MSYVKNSYKHESFGEEKCCKFGTYFFKLTNSFSNTFTVRNLLL